MSLLEKYSLDLIEMENVKKRTRIRKVIEHIERLKKHVTFVSEECVMFLHHGQKITYMFKTGYYSGATVVDGQGIKNFVSQISRKMDYHKFAKRQKVQFIDNESVRPNLRGQKGIVKFYNNHNYGVEFQGITYQVHEIFLT